MYQTHISLILKNLFLFASTFAVAIAMAPVLTKYLYEYKCWKKKPRTTSSDGSATPIVTAHHAVKEVSTPRMGGILIWATILIVAAFFYIVSLIWPDSSLSKFNFVSRSETWLPLFTLFSASILGLVDDLMVIADKGKYIGGGMRFKVRVMLVALIAFLGAWWFNVKLEWSSIFIPFYGNLEIGPLYIIIFILVVLATYSSSVVDGLDGLSAGVMLPIFLAFGVIAYSNGFYDLVAFHTVIIGALVTYLWFNVHPARFYMGETGIMGLTITLAVIAFLTNSVFFLPIIAFVLVAESASVIIQLTSKKIFKRKVFLAAPIHHHFQGLGWQESQITMRFWIISAMFSILGLVIFFLAKFKYLI